MSNGSDERCGQNQNTFNVQQFFFEDLLIYETMWENTVQSDRPQRTVKYGAGKTRSACWVTNLRTHAHPHDI